MLSVLRCLKFQQVHIAILKIKRTISQACNKVFRLYVIIRRLYFTINSVTEGNYCLIQSIKKNNIIQSFKIWY